MSRIYKKQKQLRHTAFALVAAFTLLLRFVPAKWLGVEPVHWVMSFFISVNLVTWLVFFYDKRIAAEQGVVRVPENALFALAVAGGLPSTLLAMQLLRHKRSKARFKWKLFAWFVVVYSLAGIGYWLLKGNLRSVTG